MRTKFQDHVFANPKLRRLGIIVLSIATALLLVTQAANFGGPALAAGTYSGTAFRDFNGNGTQDTLEPVIAAVGVALYNAAGASCSTTTNASGVWSIDTATCVGGGLSGASGGYRVEFSPPAGATYLQNGVYNPAAGASQSSVRFVADNGVTNINMAYQNPAQYSQDNPPVTVPFFQNASAIGKITPSNPLQVGYMSFPWTATGTSETDQNNPDPSQDVSVSDVGTVWGAAFHRTTGHIFAAAALKRHSDLGLYARPALEAPAAAVNVDGVYILNYGYDVGGTFIGGFLLNGVVPSAGTGGAISVGTVTRRNQAATVAPGVATDQYSLSTQTTFPNSKSYDIDAFAKVGTIGFGDAEMSEDDQSLWIVNLNQKSLIKINVSNEAAIPINGAVISGSLVSHYPISTTGLPTCAGQFRPWGLKFSDGFGYVGVVCDASGGTAANLAGYVLRFDPNNPTTFTSVVTIALNYVRESSSYDNVTLPGGLSQNNWNPWQSTWQQPTAGLGGNREWAMPQPVLSDIEFTEDGDMVLGFMDRNGLQAGYQNYQAITSAITNETVDGGGDLIHVCNTAGGFVVEGLTGCVFDSDNGVPNPSINGVRNTGLNNDGPGGVGEVYFRDFALIGAQSDQLVRYHLETETGALALWLGSGLVLSTDFDPITEWFNQGVNWNNTSTGILSKQYRVTPGDANSGLDQWLRTKANGLGDLELLQRPAPIEIGNRVWNDANQNGIQDPGEAGIAGVVVGIYNAAGTLIGQATTDANGNYILSSDPLGTTVAGRTYNLPITTNAQYTVAVLASNFTVGGALVGYNITPPNKNLQFDNSGFTDIRDSDAVPVPNVGSGGTLANVGVVLASTLFPGPGTNNHGLDFGFNNSPTAAEMALFTAKATKNGTVRLDWETLNELKIAGFNVLRGDSRNGDYAVVNANPIAAQNIGTLNGSKYKYTDASVTAGSTYYYRIQVLYADQSTDQTDAVKVTVKAPAACNDTLKAPALVSPENGKRLAKGKLTFKWNASKCAMRYEWQLRERSADGPIVAERKTLTKTQTSFQNLVAGTTYFWRVQSCNADNQCVASDSWSFKVRKEGETLE